MKKSTRLSRAAKIAMRAAAVLLLTAFVLQAGIFVIMQEVGVYRNSKQQVEKWQLERVMEESSRTVLEQYFHNDVRTSEALADQGVEYPEMNFEIYCGDELRAEILFISKAQVKRNGGYELLQTFSGETLMGDELWTYADSVWNDEMPLDEQVTIDSMEQENLADSYKVICKAVTGLSGQGAISNTKNIVTAAYDIRYMLVVGLVGTMIAALVLLIILAKQAGMTKGETELQVGIMERIPFDIYLCGAAVFASVAAYGLAECFYSVSWSIQNLYQISTDNLFLLAGALMLVTILISSFAVSFVEGLAVRIRKGGMIKTMLTVRILRWLKRMVVKGGRLLSKVLPLGWKAALIYAGVSLFEFFGLLICINRYEFDMLMLLWVVEKLFILAGGILLILNMQQLREGGQNLAAGRFEQKIDTTRLCGEFRSHGENLNQIGNGIRQAVEEQMKSEHFKTELITNVSHDIKTPLTSIINYVDLLEKEKIDNAAAQEYLEVLERQSARLKKLIEDLIEASKASTGALEVTLTGCEADVLLEQAAGEFEEKLKQNDLRLLVQKPEETLLIQADSRHLWRIFDNLFNNIYKYAQPGTRVYLNLEKKGDRVEITFRNTSKNELNISGEALMERFVRGDGSRSTEGSGLGISIAKSLTELMGGEFELTVDGDLFKVRLSFVS